VTVRVSRVLFDNEHDNQKWIVLQGEVEGCPAVTKRRTINVAALVDGTLTLQNEKARLIADVEEYHARWLMLQQLASEL
jgi:hypothetical protein